MPLSSAEQLMLELVNRMRLDPLGEAKRQKIALNEGLPAGTLDGTPRQALAPNALLEAAAEGHADWVLATDDFSHTGADGSSAHERMEAAGYDFSGVWSSGENLALTSVRGSIDLNAEIVKAHNALFESPSHRENTLNGAFRELGVSQQQGEFRGFNASMVVQNFATSGPDAFVTGVAFDDADRNKFYSVGEGVAGVTFSANGQSTDTARAGGYALQLAGDEAEVSIDWTGGSALVQIDLSQGNAKLDLVNGNTLMTSADMTILSGDASVVRLLGVGDIDLTGGDRGEKIFGNGGSNRIDGGGGSDRIKAGGGNDHVSGGTGSDRIAGQGGHDRVFGGEGNDTLRGNGGNDLIEGGAGADVLKGGGGNDTLSGGTEDDLLIGQRGSDTFVFSAGFDNDRIRGFALGQDALMLDQGLWTGVLTAAEVVDQFASVVNNHTVFDFGDGDTLTLLGVTNLGAIADDIILS